MTTITVMYRDFRSLELEHLQKDSDPASHVRPIHDDLRLSRNWSAKCSGWADQCVIMQGINPANELFYSTWKETRSSDKELLACDWTFLVRTLQKWRQDSEKLMQNRITSLRVLDSKREPADSARAEAITMLGSFFVLVYATPAFCSGLFSMGGDFPPGRDDF
jgi:hypothetical protein